MKELIITAGLPGVGKSYAMRILESKLKKHGWNVHWFDSDLFSKKYQKKHPNYLDLSPEEQTKIRLETHQAKIVEIDRRFNSLFGKLYKKRVILLDTCFDLLDSRKMFYKYAKKVNLWILEIKCPSNIVKKRIFENPHEQKRMVGDKQSRWDIHQQMKSWWKPIKWKNHMVIDSSRDLEAQLEIFIRKLNKT